MRIIILGKGAGWEDAPLTFQDKKVQCWGLNNHIMSRPLDMVFEPHDVEWWLEHSEDESWFHKRENRYRQHIDRVNELAVPYLTLKELSFIPTSQKYPVEEICDHFGIDYFTGGIDYMLAYAIWQKVREIEIYGVHTVYDDEYSYQKPSLEFWIGVAIGRGIKLTVHGSHSLLKPMYRGKIHTNEGKDAEGLRYGYFTKQKEYSVTQ